MIYALAVCYVSVVIGPLGFHYVPRDLGEAWRALLAIKFVEHGSDQRADWMANLAMTIPIGFLFTGAAWVKSRGALRWIAAALVLLTCLTFVVALKYAQLFFPPRTVTLNYVVAQSLGALLGIILFAVTHGGLLSVNWREEDVGARAPRITLRIYVVLLILFLLFPFDFVLSIGDLNERLTELSSLLFSWPGEGRSREIRVALMLANIIETIPLGMLLATQKKRRSLWRIAMLGFVSMTAVFVVTALVISATTNLVSIVLRTTGIVVGAATTMQLRRMDLSRLRQDLAQIVPYVWIPYAIAVLYMNGLVTRNWQSFDAARAALDVRGLLPLWHYYIVSKTQAMASLAVHAVMFAPIGVLISLRAKNSRVSAIAAGLIAFAFAFLVELGRWMRPGLQPDFNDAVIAAAAAWLAVKALPVFWQMIGRLSGDETRDLEQGLGQSAD